MLSLVVSSLEEALPEGCDRPGRVSRGLRLGPSSDSGQLSPSDRARVPSCLFDVIEKDELLLLLPKLLLVVGLLLVPLFPRRPEQEVLLDEEREPITLSVHEELLQPPVEEPVRPVRALLRIVRVSNRFRMAFRVRAPAAASASASWSSRPSSCSTCSPRAYRTTSRSSWDAGEDLGQRWQPRCSSTRPRLSNPSRNHSSAQSSLAMASRRV